MKYDYIIVGSGLTGATIARILHDSGNKVLILEKRNHIGGNVYDQIHESGIRIHTYGPHYFRTSDESIWSFVNRFANFFEYVPCLKSYVDGEFENWPISASYIKGKIGVNWKPEFKGSPTNFEESALSLMPSEVYLKFIKGYNIKQWGVDPKELSSDLIKRFDVREDDDPRLMPNHKYQGIPKLGYADFMQKIVEGIDIELNVDYLKNRNQYVPVKELIYTGPIDAFFDYKLGRLKYRGQKREDVYYDDLDFYQPCGQVNNPDLNNGPHIRTLEWKHMMYEEELKRTKGTLITKETTFTPIDPDQFEYPFPDTKNKMLYKEYVSLANEIQNVLICGRLGEYKYFDMDQAIGRAFKIANQIIKRNEIHD